MLVFGCLAAATALAVEQPPVHYLHHGVMPPGAIGSWQLQRGGPLPGFFQPVEIKAPSGASVSLAVAGQFEPSQPAPRKAGFLIGSVYRLRVSNIRLAEGAEVFPTIEIIDRLYAPVGQQCRFAIPVELTEEDLKLALAGKFVTRVIYLEDPRQATPSRENLQTQSWFEAAPGQDPLAIADGLGRPVAILQWADACPTRGRTPAFFFGSPPFVALPAGSNTPCIPGEAVASSKPSSSPTMVNNLPPPPRALPKGDCPDFRVNESGTVPCA